MALTPPYLLFLGDAPDSLAAKTAAGLVQWRPDWCLGQVRLPGCVADMGLPDMTPQQARDAGAGTLVIGVANRGGVISDNWRAALLEAVAAGLDLAAGLHQRLTDIPGLPEAAAEAGVRLHDLRHPTGALPIGSGAPRAGRRILAVGTDCSVGKMYVMLAMEREMQARGLAATFRATGQTGIFIAGAGISVDAVVADFISGAAEVLSPAPASEAAPGAPPSWDLVEGQGSLFHPSFAGVSLGLLHGAQPRWLVLCHEPGRPHMRGLPDRPLPDLETCLEANLAAARLTSPEVRPLGIALNTAALSDKEAAETLAITARRLALPAVDPLRTGVGPLIDRLIAEEGGDAS